MILEIFLVVLVAALLFLLAKYIQLKTGFDQKVKEWIESEEKKIREDAIARSARTLSGKTLEKLIPFLDRFSYDAHDARWLGDPIDFVIFDGLSEDKTKQIVFCEVKSGNSKLTTEQNRIKELIENKKVRWYEFRI